MNHIRNDIQALRGIAVLLVLIFHAEFNIFPAGYLGVDIFFVISGFLITGMIMREIELQKFSFKDFYMRRARRLLPASFLLIFFTTIASFWILTSTEYENFKIEALGSVTFTSNMVFWQGTNYFSTGSHLKPLLHMWSLSIEEQFYFLIPLALFILPKKLWLPCMALGVFISLAVCLYMVRESPIGTFFLLPSRAWEFGIGCIGAFFVLKKTNLPFVRWLFWPSCAALILIPIFWNSPNHPGMGAFFICIATIFVILANKSVPDKNLPMQALSHIGNISYSLYLVHWPLFALAKNLYIGGEVPLSVRVSLFVASFFLAYPLYYVENRYRYATGTELKALMKKLALCGLILIALPFILGTVKKSPFTQTFAPNVGLFDGCDNIYDPNYNQNCTRGEAPEILLWGDSFAMHLALGIEESSPNGMVQLTKHSCAPVFNMAHVTPPIFGPLWSRKCIEHNEQVHELIEKYPSIKTVIMSSPLIPILDPEYHVMIRDNGEHSQKVPDVDLALKKFKETAQFLREKGKKVVLVSPTVRRNYNIAFCAERYAGGLFTMGPYKDCPANIQTTMDDFPYLYDFLQRVETEGNIPLIDLSDYICKDGTCYTIWDDIVLYRDASHLSIDGTKTLFKKTTIMEDTNNKAK